MQAFAQVAVATVIVYAGLIVNTHMESWTKSLSQGAEDLHSIRTNMNAIAYSMEAINSDMDRMNQSTHQMEKHLQDLRTDMVIMNNQIHNIKGSVGIMADKFSPGGMMRGFSPF